jgi:hypothetical protein
MMTIAENLLRKLAEWRPDTRHPTLELAQPDSGWRVRVQADHVDVIGVRLQALSLTREGAAAPERSLAERAGQLANRVTGLLEPLRVLEVGETAQLRSAAPTQRGDEVAYYEILVQDSGATVQRYQASRTTTVRQAVPFCLTHEALGKLVEDITTSV